MFLLFGEFSFENPIYNLILLVVIIGGWLCSTFLIFRGFFYFIKSEQKLKLVILTLVLFAVLQLALYILPNGSAFITAFPFGLFGGFPFLFFFDSRDSFVYGILMSIGSYLNVVGWISLGDLIAKKFG